MEDKKLVASIFSAGLGDVNFLALLWQMNECRQAGATCGCMPEQPGSHYICLRINARLGLTSTQQKNHLVNCGSKRMSWILPELTVFYLALCGVCKSMKVIEGKVSVWKDALCIFSPVMLFEPKHLFAWLCCQRTWTTIQRASVSYSVAGSS